MTKTLIATEPLMAPYVDLLQDLNVRYIEQFLCMTPSKANIAIIFGITVSELDTLVEAVKKNHPEIVMPEHRDEDYYMGLRIDKEKRFK